MKKKFIGIIFISMMILVGISGCVEDNINEDKSINENNIISLKELQDNLDNYIGKNITTEGYIKQAQGENASQFYVTYLCDSNNPSSECCCSLNIPLNVTSYTGKYQITGTVGIITNLSIPEIDVFSAELID